jgi:hypothetical protein
MSPATLMTTWAGASRIGRDSKLISASIRDSWPGPINRSTPISTSATPTGRAGLATIIFYTKSPLAPTPVSPTLTDPKTQQILTRIFYPANCSYWTALQSNFGEHFGQPTPTPTPQHLRTQTATTGYIYTFYGDCSLSRTLYIGRTRPVTLRISWNLPPHSKATMVQTIQAQLDGFNPATAGTYNPGQVVIFFDHRSFISEKDSMSRYQSYWLSTKSRLGWPSFWYTSDLEPGKLRLVWYTVSLKTSNPPERFQQNF